MQLFRNTHDKMSEEKLTAHNAHAEKINEQRKIKRMIILRKCIERAVKVGASQLGSPSS